MHVERQGFLESFHPGMLACPANPRLRTTSPHSSKATRHLSSALRCLRSPGCALLLSALLLPALFSGCQATPATPQIQTAVIPDSPQLRAYRRDVLPILQSNCARCHGGMNRRGGLNMSTRAMLLQGGKDGPVVIPGRPEDSLLVKVISPGLADGDPMRMPQKGSLTAAEVATLRKWVADGVVMDR